VGVLEGDFWELGDLVPLDGLAEGVVDEEEVDLSGEEGTLK
jgi:hypothetical protein